MSAIKSITNDIVQGIGPYVHYDNVQKIDYLHVLFNLHFARNPDDFDSLEEIRNSIGKLKKG